MDFLRIKNIQLVKDVLHLDIIIDKLCLSVLIKTALHVIETIMCTVRDHKARFLNLKLIDLRLLLVLRGVYLFLIKREVLELLLEFLALRDFLLRIFISILICVGVDLLNFLMRNARTRSLF